MSQLSNRLGAAVLASGLIAVAVWAWAQSARAEQGYQHVVREGETLASIAERYYGDPRRESVLVAENGLTTQGGAAIVVGLRLHIPFVHYHRVEEGESWAELARRFYGDARRAFILVDANRGAMSEQPDVGAELLIPYPLRHIAGQNDNILRISKTYLGAGVERARALRRFNFLRFNRTTRGQVVLVPLGNLVLSEEGRSAIEAQTGTQPNSGEVRELQARIDGELPDLIAHVKRGRFTEAVALGNRLLGARMLTGSQIVTIQRELATAYVALGRHDLAIQSFRAALDRQPQLVLDTVATSPTVMRAFDQARELNEAAHSDNPAAPDAGDAAAPIGRPILPTRHLVCTTVV